MPPELVARIAGGAILGLFLLVAPVVLLLLVRSRRAPEEARSDGGPAGPLMAGAEPVDQRPATFPHGGPAPDGIGPADVPAGYRMAPLDRWDVLAVVLILVMALAAAPGGEAIAFLLLVAVLLDSRFRIRVLLRDR